MRKLFVVALFAVAPAMLGQIGRFEGDWKNANPASRGIVRVIVRSTGTGAATIQVFGSCTPTPCDWGVQPAVLYAPTVSSNPATTANAMTTAYKFSFKDVIVVLRPEGSALSGQFFNRFTPGDGRTNYALFERFVRK